jgi:hypothetical protein
MLSCFDLAQTWLPSTDRQEQWEMTAQMQAQDLLKRSRLLHASSSQLEVEEGSSDVFKATSESQDITIT